MDAAGQVFAQSLDNLSNIQVIISNSNNSSMNSKGGGVVVGVVAGRRAIRHVKSILSTGHLYMFFTLTEHDDDGNNKLPVFQFLGTYSIDILPPTLQATWNQWTTIRNQCR